MDRYPIGKAGERMSPFSQVKAYAGSLKRGESHRRSENPSERLSAPRTCTVLRRDSTLELYSVLHSFGLSASVDATGLGTN